MGKPIHTRLINGAGIWAGERVLARVSGPLVRSRLSVLGYLALQILRVRWQGRSMRAEHATTPRKPVPTGPFRTTRPREAGDLLLWVPRGWDSYLIDDLTGKYGYSHATVDMGEIDVPTGKPVMAEITIGQTVEHKFQDEYGKRAYVRMPLVRAGVEVDKLVACVESKMGEHYDMLDALTLGEIEDPVREVCSGLIADCLPGDELRAIGRAKKLGLLQRGSVSLHSGLEAATLKAFVSPNGLAEYYGAPRGRKVRRPNTFVEPKPVGGSIKRTATQAARHQGWKAAAALLAMGTIGLVVRRTTKRGSS